MNNGFELPVIAEDAGARADATRNRARILETAARLFSERGPDCVSMDCIAEAAGVGKGTVFRRFGSRAALAQAVLSESERDFQERMIRGEPPLGPGAPPCERLIAFGEGVLDHLDSHAALIAAAELGGARFNSAPYGVYRAHVALLLALRGLPLERFKAAWRELVTRVLEWHPAHAASTARGLAGP